MRSRPVKKAAKPCGKCGLCDLFRFESWRERIEKGLPESLEESSDRFGLILEMHEDVGRRYPLGIAVRLACVIEALACREHGNDADASMDLADLEEDERASAKLNGAHEVGCKASVRVFKKRDASKTPWVPR